MSYTPKANRCDVFTNLIEIIYSEENIRLAYRNIKCNLVSQTSGVGKLSIKDTENAVIHLQTHECAASNSNIIKIFGKFVQNYCNYFKIML